MKFFEIEQKYKMTDPKRVRAALKKMGARKIAGGTETNEFFDLGKQLRERRLAMRLRTYGKKAVLTLKGPRLKSRFTKRMEIEAPVDYGPLKTILGLAGFKVVKGYKKERELYRLGQSLIALDWLPRFGRFLEIEGPLQSIPRIEKKLGLRDSDREERSYLQMLFNWKQ
ncbi:MAG: class IV adenylate cyclase [Candidatus Omnitrophota bacterium]